MSDTVANAKAFTFETTERLEVTARGGDKKSLNFTRKVVVRRPNALFFELHGTGGATPIDVSAYYDGKNLTLIDKPDGKWAQTAVPGTLDEMLDDVARRFRLPVPIGDVVYSSPYDALIGTKSRGGIAALETIDGVECIRLEYGDDFVDVTLWLPASGPALPHSLELSYKRASTPMVAHINFTNWKLDAVVTDATFAFQPPSGRDSVDFGKFVSELVSASIPSEPSSTPMAQ